MGKRKSAGGSEPAKAKAKAKAITTDEVPKEALQMPHVKKFEEWLCLGARCNLVALQLLLSATLLSVPTALFRSGVLSRHVAIDKYFQHRFSEKKVL